MMYHNVDNNLQIHYELKYALTASVAALICTVGATVFSCWQALAEDTGISDASAGTKRRKANLSGAHSVFYGNI